MAKFIETLCQFRSTFVKLEGNIANRVSHRSSFFDVRFIHRFVVVPWKQTNSIRTNSKYVYFFFFFYRLTNRYDLFDFRHQFYLHSRLELLEGRLKAADWSSVVRLVAWIAQADIGDYDPLSPPNALYSQCCQIQPVERCESKPQDLIHRIVQQHKEMKVIPPHRIILKNFSKTRL